MVEAISVLKHFTYHKVILLVAGEVRLTVRQDASLVSTRPTSAQVLHSTPSTPSMPHLSRASSFQRSFRRSSSFTSEAQVASVGPGDSFGDEVCGMASSEATTSRRWENTATSVTQQFPLHVSTTAYENCLPVDSSTHKHCRLPMRDKVNRHVHLSQCLHSVMLDTPVGS